MAGYAVRQIGDPVLTQRAADVTAIDGTLVGMVETMFDTMYGADGCGLAAPQVGILKRFFVFDMGDEPGVLLNPTIVESSGETVFSEGCLSIVGVRFDIVRPEIVTVAGVDLDGNELVIEADDYFARMLQHELDHLDGTLMIDRLDPDARKAALRELRRRDELAAVPAGGNPFGR